MSDGVGPTASPELVDGAAPTDQQLAKRVRPAPKKKHTKLVEMSFPNRSSGRVSCQELVDSFDWNGSPLGPRAGWSFAISSTFDLCMSLTIPTAIYLGKQHMTVWNEEYSHIAGPGKHPSRFGLSVKDVYPELPFLHDKVQEVFDTGVPFGANAFRALINNEAESGFQTEGFYNWTLGPLRDVDGDVCAVFNACNDITTQILLDRRTTALGALATKAARGMSVAGVTHSMVNALEDAPDVTWMAVYVKNDDEHKQDMDFADKLAGQGQARSLGRSRSSRVPYRLVSTSFDKDLVRYSYSSSSDGDEDEDLSRSSRRGEDRFEPGTSSRPLPDWLPPLPDKIRLRPVLNQGRRESTTTSSATSELVSTPSTNSDEWSMGSSTPSEPPQWPFDALTSDTKHIVLATPTDTSPYAESIMLAITTLSPSTGHEQVLGVIVAGLNENRKLDEAYLKFFQSIASQFETAFLNGKAREEDRRAADALRRLNHDRVQFFQNTAHELRTPLTLMLGPLEELVEAHTTAASAPPTGQTLARLSLISRNARRLLKLVNSILRFSSIEAGKLDTRFERQSSFGMVTRKLAECFEPMSAQSGVALVLDQGLALTSAHSDETVFDKITVDSLREDVFIDVDLWEQIIFNTLSNAFKNTWKGAITVSLYETEEDGQDGFRLDVADTGVGISKEQLGSIFERFYRADNSEARSAEGTGIGLSLVRELVRLHGGNISATSQLGKGTTFTVWIPRGLNHLPHDRVFATSDPGVDEADRPHTSRAAGDRWNAKARGVERAAILEQMDSLMQESQPMSLSLTSRFRETSNETLSSRASQVSRSGAGSPTPLAPPAGLPQGSYFPDMEAIAQDEEEMQVSTTTTKSASPPPEAKKRRIGSAHWHSSNNADDNARPGLGRAQSGLPMLDPSDRATILVVDDNQDMRFWIQSILQVDYNVVEARNGREALEAVKIITPDLVLSDVNMPLMNGLSLVKALRSDQRISQIPVILLSARSGQEDAIEGLDAGAADYLTKPFNVRDLLARCRVHVRLNKLRLQTRQVENELLIEQSKTEAKNNLLGLVSHELRTPLQTIQGAADLLSRTPQVPTDLVDAISSGAQALGSRIDQLIDVSQVGSNRFQLAMSTFDLGTALNAALAKHAPVAAKNGVNVRSEVGGAPSQVTTDKERLVQVLDVLLANAVKFTQAGEVVLRVWVENAAGEQIQAEPSNDPLLCFSVTDSGAGIPQELAATIFQPFSLADSSSTRTHGGAGLGLTLALRLVELAGGQLGVESTLGKGSEFRCRWPVQVPPKAQASAVLPARSPSAVDRFPRGRLLVAEDNKINAKLLIRQLNALGFAGDEAGDGVKALDFIAAESNLPSPYVGILMDLDMPRMDGFEATKRVRAMGGRFSHLPVLAVSANGSPDIRERVAAVGMGDFLTKPVSISQLTDLLQRNGLITH